MAEINRIQIFGERNSGTNYMRKLMRDNYKSAKTVGGDQGFGWKHGDIGKPWCYFEDESTKFCHAIQDYKKDSDDVLFVVMYRNPIEWLQSMHQHPHHAPSLWNVPFSSFLEARWESYYGKPGQEIDPSQAVRQAMMRPEEKFESFGSIFELRNEKIKTFEAFSKKVKNVCFLNYEFIRDNPNEVLEQIALHYKISLKKQFKNITESKFGDGKYKRKKYPALSKSQLQLIDKNLDWKLEQKIGYSRIDDAWENALSQSLLSRLLKQNLDSGADTLVDYSPKIRFKK